MSMGSAGGVEFVVLVLKLLHLMQFVNVERYQCMVGSMVAAIRAQLFRSPVKEYSEIHFCFEVNN